MKQLVLVSVMVLFGCAVGPDFQTPAPPEAQPYTRDAPASAAQTFPAADTATRMRWIVLSTKRCNRARRSPKRAPS
jgi:hypothetical protein